MIGNLFVPPLHAAGKHEFKLGVDFDRIDDHQEFSRQPYLVENAERDRVAPGHLYERPAVHPL